MLTRYDRIKIDSPTYIRTVNRKPGRGESLLAPVARHTDGYVTPKVEWDRSRFDKLGRQVDHLMAELSKGGKPKVMAALEAELDRTLAAAFAEGKGHADLHEIGKLIVTRKQFRRDGIKRQQYRDPDHARKVATKAHAALAESADRGW